MVRYLKVLKYVDCTIFPFIAAYRSYVVRCLSLMFVGWTVSIPSFEFPFLTV